MSAEVVFKRVSAGLALVNDLAKFVADGDMFDAFGFDFHLSVGGVGIDGGGVSMVFRNANAVLHDGGKVIVPVRCFVCL